MMNLSKFAKPLLEHLPPFLITMFIKIDEQLCPQNKSKVGHPINMEKVYYILQ